MSGTVCVRLAPGCPERMIMASKTERSLLHAAALPESTFEDIKSPRFSVVSNGRAMSWDCRQYKPPGIESIVVP